MTVKEIIRTDYPGYLSDFETVMKKQKVSLFNMIALDKESFDKYCEWLFSILFSAEKKIDITNRTSYQSRVFGFLAERLMNVWLYHNRNSLNIRELPLYFYSGNRIGSFYKNLKRLVSPTLIGRFLKKIKAKLQS